LAQHWLVPIVASPNPTTLQCAGFVPTLMYKS
jgi:hypothetical protein